MEELNTLKNATGLTGLQGATLGAQVVFAVQGMLILFFVVSPVMGYVLSQQIKDRSRLIIGFCLGMLIVCVGHVGLTLLLIRILPEGALPDWAVGLLSIAASGAVGMLVGKYILWVMADPGTPQWLTESDKRPYHELAPFEKRRRDEMNRRRAARGESMRK